MLDECRGGTEEARDEGRRFAENAREDSFGEIVGTSMSGAWQAWKSYEIKIFR